MYSGLSYFVLHCYLKMRILAWILSDGICSPGSPEIPCGSYHGSDLTQIPLPLAPSAGLKECTTMHSLE